MIIEVNAELIIILFKRKIFHMSELDAAIGIAKIVIPIVKTIVTINIESRERRSKMTPEEIAEEDARYQPHYPNEPSVCDCPFPSMCRLH